MRQMRKWLRLPWRDRLLLAEAVLWLGLGALAIAWLPFRWLARLAGRPLQVPPPERAEEPDLIRRVRWAVLAAARRVPWRAVCFQRGLAAHLMLRRRGVPSVLHCGAARDGARGLIGHVWVRVGETDVTGGAIAARFATLAKFPDPMP
jgi:hypothetical protein